MSEPQLITVDGVTMTPDVVRDLLGGPGGMHLLTEAIASVRLDHDDRAQTFSVGEVQVDRPLHRRRYGRAVVDEVVELPEHDVILCPRCHQASDNVANGYCPRCHAWTGTPR